MNSNRYYIGIIIRVILIVLSSLLLAFTNFYTNYLYSISSLIIIVAIQTWNLIRYILKRNDELKRMLEYIRENNPTIYFSQSRVYPFNELGLFLNEIGGIVKEVRIEKESQLRYMQYIVEHIRIGLIAFDQSGKVDIINHAAKSILNIKEIASIEDIDKMQSGLSEIFKKMNPVDQKVIVLTANEKLLHLAIRVSIFRIGQKEIRLVSLQDIKNELDEKELDSWQKLIRVLTHEIINSVTPVTSLTGTISRFFRYDEKVVTAHEISDSTIREALTGLDLIEERGKALIEFVNKFRSLTKLPTPKFEKVKLSDLLKGIAQLKKDELAQKGITFYFTVNEDMSIICDRGLIEQVLLNLINNAVDATCSNIKSKGKVIEVKSWEDMDQRPVISITDNGIGIPYNLIDEIFIPFFTTKETGSGIGLSLSRQIMQMHNGTIKVQSEEGKGSVFSLGF